MNASRVVGLIGAVACGVLGAGCPDPSKVVDSYFNDVGLNRLAAPRTGIEPGAFFIVGSGQAVYADNMTDYLTTAPDTVQLTIVAGDGMSDYDAVLKGYKDDRSMGPEVALGLLEKVLPVKLEGKLKLSSNVKIDMVSAKVRRLRIPSLRAFLNAEASRPFRLAVREALQQGSKPFVAYETWRTDKLRIVAEGGKDISAGLDANVHEIDAKLDAKLTYQRKTTSTIEIQGTTQYVFAVRAAQLKAGGTPEAVQLDITKTIKPKAGGLKAVGDDSEFSTPMLAGYAAVTVVPRQ